MVRWLTTFGGLCLLALVRSAAVPTQDTMVVARSDDTAATTPTAVADPTTDESSQPIKLTEMEVISEVSLRYAHTTVVARVRNPAKRAQEANFRVLLPETAFISGFIMTLDGKSYKAYVKEKEEAKRIYSDAVSQGLGAAHVSAKARDSNHFTVSVNVEASSNAVFNLTYEELLFRRNGVYNHAINLHPGALVPKLTVTVHIKEAEKIVELRVPEIRTGNEIDATKDDAQNSRATIVRGHDDREATITFTPDLQEQERLIQLYTEKSKESAAASHSFSSYPWHYDSQPETTTPEGVLGQFVVQYDVARPKDGEVLVNDGYFVHFFAPTDLQPLNKFVVFVLDTSGSMMDRKIVQLREAMQTILSELNVGDYFSIVEFASSVTVHDLKEADGEPPKRQYAYFDYTEVSKLVPPSQATPENIAKAKLIVSWLQAAGGTNIGRALDVAVELINKGVDWEVPVNASAPTTQSTESSPETTSSTTAASTEVSTEKKPVNKKSTKSLEPIIIFLTDGDPTVGQTDPKRILTQIQEKNYGENKATIFSLAFGEDADRKFLRKLSLRNGGFMRHIYEAADAALQLRDFYRQISSPLLAHLKFTYPTAQVKSDSLTKHDFRSFYGGSEVVVAGRVEDDATELTPQIEAFCGVDDGNGRKRYEIVPKVPIEKKKTGYLPLERLWSYLTIKQLLDKKDAGEDEPTSDTDEKTVHEKRALELALKYSFVTPLTSLVVVKPNATNAVDAESVDKAAGPQFLPMSISANMLAARPMAAYAFSGAPGAPAPSYVQSIGAFGAPGQPGPFGLAADYISPEADIRVEEQAVDDYEAVDGYGGGVSSFSSSHTSYPSHRSVFSSYPSHSHSSGRSSSFSSSYSAPRLSKSSVAAAYPTSSNYHSYGGGVSSFSSSHTSSYPSHGGLFSSYPSHSYGGGVSSFSSSHTSSYPSSYPSHGGLFSSYPSHSFPRRGGAYGGISPLIAIPKIGQTNVTNFYLTTPAPFPLSTGTSTTTFVPPTGTTSKPVLADFYLQDFTWLQPLYDANNRSIILPTNDTTVSLKLTRDTIAPKEATGDVACPNAVDGGAGVCVYLTRCDSAKQITSDIYLTTYCTVSEGYAGVCCQQAKVDIVH